jgi:hypothetical protein
MQALRSRMPTDRDRLFRFGGVAFIVGGALFLSYDLLEFIAGPPPPNGAGILQWITANKLTISLISEVLFFASISLVPAVSALYVSLADRPQKALVVMGCGILAVVVPIIGVLLIVHGRLVYPVFGLQIRDPAIAEFAIALFFGGIHAVDLLLAGAIFVLSLAMRGSVFGTRTAALGFATAVGSIVGSYPHLIGPAALVVCRLSFVAWLVVVGVKLFRASEQAVTGHRPTGHRS